MTKCPVCGEWTDLKGVYICPKCGSPDMVAKANEPVSVEIWKNRLDTLKEVAEFYSDGLHTCLDEYDLLQEKHQIQQKHIDEIEDLLRRVLSMMLDELNEAEKAQLFLDVRSYIEGDKDG